MLKKFFLLMAMLVSLTGCLTTSNNQQNTLSYYQNFEKVEIFPETWEVKGDVKLDKRGPFKGKQALTFTRTLETVETPTSIIMDSFPVEPGLWDVKLVRKAKLHSPDSSFNGTVYFDVLNKDGKLLEKYEISVISGKKGWKEFRKRVEIGRAHV